MTGRNGEDDMAIEKVVNKTPLKQRNRDAAYWRAWNRAIAHLKEMS
jgi:hypothetical protein